MANSIDINIHFKGDNNPEKPENDNQVESKPSKAQEKLNTEALKPKIAPKPKTASKSEAEPKQSSLEKYASGKSTSSQELLTELESSKVKVSKELKALMSKGALYVQKDTGFKGRAFQSIDEKRDHPNQNKRRMNERVSKALESLLKEKSNTFAELATNTEAVQTPVVEQVQTPVIETPVTEQVVSKTPVTEQSNYKISGSKKAKELFSKAVELVSKETGIDLDLSNYSVSTSKKFNKNFELKDVTGFLDEATKKIELLDVSGKRELSGAVTENDFLNTAVHELMHVLQTQTQAFKGNLFEELPHAIRPNEIHARRGGSYIVGKYLLEQGKISKETFEKFHKPEHLLPETAISEYEQLYKGKEKQYYKEGEQSKKVSAIESVANALEKPEPITKEVEQVVQPVAKAKDDLFDYTQESPGKPAEPVVATKTKNAKKKLNDAIVSNIEQAAQSAAESINKAMSGDGGKKPPKGPKAPPTGDDDESGYGDDMYEGAENDDEYNPLRTLKAQVENLQRSFESKLFGEKESTFPSSLQRTFEAGKRVKDFDDIQKLIDKEVAAQTSMLKAFETSNQNTSNLLEARIKDYIVRESSKEDEKIDRQKLEWLYSRLDEVRKVREDTQQEYAAIETSIGTKISDSATRGFAQGKVDRDIEELQMQQKDEDKVLKQYQREFKSFVTKQYKDLANVEAFEAAKTYVQTNTGKMPQRDVVAMAKIAYDKKFEEFMASASFESELSTEEVMSAFQEGQGKFKPEAFRPKNAPKNFYGKSQQEEPPIDIQWDPMQGGAGSGMMGGGSGNGSSFPIGFGPGGTPIPPSRNNIGLLAPSVGVDIQAIKRFKIAESAINAVGQTLVAASSKQGVRPGAIYGQATNIASTVGLAGYAAQGAAGIAGGLGMTTPGIAAAGVAGSAAGPVGLLVAGVTLSASYLSEIADNTSRNAEAFSPELIMAKIDNNLQNLATNMAIANQRGAALASYQQSSNLLSRQLYELGSDFFAVLTPGMQIAIDMLSIITGFIRYILLVLMSIFSFLQPLATGASTFFKQSAEGWAIVGNWLSGKGKTQIPDYTQELMKNDPRKP